MENKDFDKYIRKQVGKIEPEFQSSDWDEMESLLEETEQASRRWAYAKGVEFVLVLLVLVTVFRLYPDMEQAVQSYSMIQTLEKRKPWQD